MRLLISIRNQYYDILFLLLIIYNFHRYLFKYNSTYTSPTYTDTPFLWKALKYILVSIVITMIYCRIRRFQISMLPPILILYCVLLYLIFVNVLFFLFVGQLFFDEIEYIFYFILLMPFAFFEKDELENLSGYIERNLNRGSWLLVIFNFIVIFNFFVFGRLPALAYSNSLLVRFGSFWDDPNGFGMVCVFLFFIHFQRREHLLSFCLLICIVLTISFSAYLLLTIGFLYWLFDTIYRLRISWLIVCTVGFSLLSSLIAIYWPFFFQFYKLKSGSIAAHSTFSHTLTFSSLLNEDLIFHETWFYSFLINYSPFSILAVLVILFWLIMHFLGQQKDFYSFYIFIFLVGCFFLPFFYTFPLNFFFALFLILYLKGIRLEFRRGLVLKENG